MHTRNTLSTTFYKWNAWHRFRFWMNHKTGKKSYLVKRHKCLQENNDSLYTSLLVCLFFHTSTTFFLCFLIVQYFSLALFFRRQKDTHFKIPTYILKYAWYTILSISGKYIDEQNTRRTGNDISYRRHVYLYCLNSALKPVQQQGAGNAH